MTPIEAVAIVCNKTSEPNIFLDQLSKEGFVVVPRTEGFIRVEIVTDRGIVLLHLPHTVDSEVASIASGLASVLHHHGLSFTEPTLELPN